MVNKTVLLMTKRDIKLAYIIRHCYGHNIIMKILNDYFVIRRKLVASVL